MLAHDGGNRIGVGTALPAPDDDAGIVDDANGCRLERNVEADIVALLIHAPKRGSHQRTGEVRSRVWLRTEAVAIELRCGETSRDGGSGPTGRSGECRINRPKMAQDGRCVDHA